MKTRALDIHRWNLEVQIEIKDDAKFNPEVQNATGFDIRSGIAIARFSSYRKKNCIILPFCEDVLNRGVPGVSSARQN